MYGVAGSRGTRQRLKVAGLPGEHLAGVSLLQPLYLRACYAHVAR